jgi:hypothetical protein
VPKLIAEPLSHISEGREGDDGSNEAANGGLPEVAVQWRGRWRLIVSSRVAGRLPPGHSTLFQDVAETSFATT